MTKAECAELRDKLYNATVSQLRKVTPELAILRIKPDFMVPPHKPGQYTTLGLGPWEPRVEGCQVEIPKPVDGKKLIRRTYSISCPILDDSQQLLDWAETRRWLEFYIVLVRKSNAAPAMTPRLFALRQGDRTYFGEKIVGHFTLDPVKPNDTVVFLATGTGEAPHNYMIWDLLRRAHMGRILSICCVRYQRDLGYLAVHQELMRRYPNYTYLSLTTREAESIQRKVYIQDLLTSGQLEECLGKRLDPYTAHVYLCGNPKMIGAPIRDRTTGKLEFPRPLGVVEILCRRQFQIDQPSLRMIGNIHYEAFW